MIVLVYLCLINLRLPGWNLCLDVGPLGGQGEEFFLVRNLRPRTKLSSLFETFLSFFLTFSLA